MKHSYYHSFALVVVLLSVASHGFVHLMGSITAGPLNMASDALVLLVREETTILRNQFFGGLFWETHYGF
jgi:hypothetical protein